MPNINSNPATVASASLAVEVHKPQGDAPQKVAPTAASLSQGENVQLATYTVKKGDTLWDIAKVQLSDPTQWPKIHNLNKSIIANPDLIFPGQVLTLPKQLPAPSPAAPQAPIPSPVSEPPAAVTQPAVPIPVSEPVVQPQPPAIEPTPPVVVTEPTPAPVAVEPPAPPVSPEPSAPVAPVAPVEEPKSTYPTELRHPSLLPDARADVPLTVTPSEPTGVEPPVQDPGNQPITEPPAAQPPSGFEPTQPPVATDPKPTTGGLADQVNQVTGTPKSGSSGVGNAALIGGVIGTAGTAGALMYATSKISSNLGGYATAQVVAKGANNVLGKVGLSVPTGPALSSLVKRIGGPKVAGAATAVGVGIVVAGVAAGGYYLYNKATGSDKNESAPQAPTPPAQSPVQNPAQAPAQIDIGDISPVQAAPNQVAPTPPAAEQVAAEQVATQPPATETAPQAAEVPVGPPQIDNIQPTIDLSAGFNKLNEILNNKTMFGYGKIADPAALTAASNELWTKGGIEDRVQLGSTLVNNGQAQEFGRILVNSGVQDVEIAQVLTHESFPVSKFMSDIDDTQSGIILMSLGSISAQGHDPSTQALTKIVGAYNGRIRDREAPFQSMQNQMQANDTWTKLPNPLQVSISELLK